ncbi:MAG: penicillin-binding transpeptidase domain-containing protein, partial [Egibacteraceae bacterium]
EYTPPQTTYGIGNFGGGLCEGGGQITLQRAFEVSCNTTFARLGVHLGAEKLVSQAEGFGLNADWEFDLPIATSRIPEPAEIDPPAAAQSAIGQRDVQVTPLQMAMIAGTVANDGVLLRPRLIDRVQTFSGRTVREFRPQTMVLPGADDADVLSPRVAATLRQMMVGVVERGSGGNAAISGVQVAGKTGTAQTAEGVDPTVWFVGFAPADDPRVAVAVVVPNGGDEGSEATGGVVAAPIAKAVIEAVLQE